MTSGGRIVVPETWRATATMRTLPIAACNRAVPQGPKRMNKGRVTNARTGERVKLGSRPM